MESRDRPPSLFQKHLTFTIKYAIIKTEDHKTVTKARRLAAELARTHGILCEDNTVKKRQRLLNLFRHTVAVLLFEGRGNR